MGDETCVEKWCPFRWTGLEESGECGLENVVTVMARMASFVESVC